jgi:hypothetical protein
MSQRQCGSCTACCEGWIKATVNGVTLSPFKPCVHRTDKGCNIYEERPANPCVSFKCGWLMDNSVLPDNMSPQECGAIIVLDRKWHDSNYIDTLPMILAFPIGAKIPNNTLERLKNHSSKNEIPLIWYENIIKNGKFIRRIEFPYGPLAFVESTRNAIKKEDVFVL